MQQFVPKQTGTEDLDEAEISFVRPGQAALREIASKLKAMPGVTQVEGPDVS